MRRFEPGGVGLLYDGDEMPAARPSGGRPRPGLEPGAVLSVKKKQHRAKGPSGPFAWCDPVSWV